jgi:ribosomal protein L37AE/L43A
MIGLRGCVMAKEIVLEEIPKKCPKCGSKRYVVKSHYDIFITCKACGHKGPGAEKLWQAIRNWNRQVKNDD